MNSRFYFIKSILFKNIYNGLVKNQKESIFSKLNFIFFSVLRKIILHFHDPLINFIIWNKEVKIPFSYNLPIILKLHKNYNSNLKRIVFYLSAKYHNLRIIDIGANIGDTVTLLKSQADYEILCIEGDEFFYKILELNCKEYSNVTLVKEFLGEKEKEISAKLNSKLGTGNIKASDQSKLRIRTLSNLLKEIPNFYSSKLLKVDTDGYDFKIIRGSQEFLEKTKPLIFIEFDPAFHKVYNENSEWIFDNLVVAGYTKVIFYDNFGDYLISLDISQRDKIAELINYFSNRGSEKYCDLCFFHKEDEDIFAIAQKEEQEFFLKNR